MTAPTVDPELRSYEICTLPGDGIGPEVVGCAVRVLEALSASKKTPSFRINQQEAGAGTFERTGQALPDHVLEVARSADAVLVGAMDGVRLAGHGEQPLRLLRRAFEVSASVRPAKSVPGLSTPAGPIDVVVVREVTEGLYSGIEFRAGVDAASAVRVVTRGASMRAAVVAFRQAEQRRGKVTAVHKLGGMPITDGLFLESVRAVAADYPNVQLDTMNIDACAMELVHGRVEFDVILATNAFGDIISDLCAGLAGGLGLAPSGCIGPKWAYFEPVHGTAPDIAGKGIANPLATILSLSLMLRHLGELGAASHVEAAALEVVGRGTCLTPDLGGTASTTEVTDAVLDALTVSINA